MSVVRVVCVMGRAGQRRRGEARRGEEKEKSSKTRNSTSEGDKSRRKTWIAVSNENVPRKFHVHVILWKKDEF